ncbi:MAG: VWA domain-containing protein [Thiobacillus sp.]|uniref:vWA domain-containing protein n=1 Tax=Thiobacillus sp. TaxID=924 RepID=UPI002732C358|nr:VWA domain-containing protein [Thiobacillus sp.]MDP3586263.1 VWA domain-containing protein [Thiobacillus sp.]
MMDFLLQLHWREPGWLGLAAVPLLLGWWRGQRRARLLRYADAALLPWAASASSARAGHRMRRAVHALAWLLLALAAAGPRQPIDVREGEGEVVPRHLLTLAVVVDLSASMRATDLVPRGDAAFLRTDAPEKPSAPDRLSRARIELLDLLPRLHGERLALIVYAGEAGVLLPPTDDTALFERALDQLDPRLIDAQGSNLAAALDLARAQLDAAPGQAKAVLLLSDVETDSVDAAAHAAVAALRQARLPLFVLGVGSADGAPVPLPDGGLAARDGVPLLSRMDSATYRQWADASGGRFAAVSDGDADWAQLYDGGIARLPGDSVAPGDAPAWREHYPWLLAPALALLMAVSLPRRAVASAALLVLGAALVPSPVRADEATAWQAWQQKQYAVAQARYAQIGGYAGQMGAGAAAWRQGDYAAAVRHFGAALLQAGDERARTDALYNLGNAHYGNGNPQAAAEAFEIVLRLRPGDARARANLDQAQRLIRHRRADVAAPSDLRGRRGYMAEGIVALDRDSEALPDPESDAPGMQLDRAAPGDGGAHAADGVPPRARARLDPRLAASGLKKLDGLQDRPATLLKNLLKQDARHDDTPRPPW